ncbi:MAG: hypothetical protein HOW73_45060 [Polyangiaceae bacterium]|nr:hypothetical protein [Polyangiaceae bacterium]
MTDAPIPRPSRAATGMLHIFSRVGTITRRAAVCLLLLAPFMRGGMIAPCVFAAFIYGHIGGGPRKRGRFVADADGIRLESGALVLPRAMFSMAFTQDDGEGKKTLCFIRAGEIVAELRVEDAAARQALLEDLGFGSEPRVLRDEGAVVPETRAIASVVGYIVSGCAFAFAARHDSLLTMAGALLLMAWTTALLVRRDVHIGYDGIWVAAPFQRYWVPFRDLRGVSRAGYWIRLHTARGDVDMSPPLPWPGRRSRAAGEALIQLIKRAATRYDRLPDMRAVPSSMRDDALSAPREGAFRESPVFVEDLARIVENPRAESKLRIRAAAALLTAAPTPDNVDCVKLAEEEAAEPELREGLRGVRAARAG